MIPDYGYKSYTADFPIHKDIDVRESVYNTLYGSAHEQPRGQWIVWQKLKRDAQDRPIKSPYVYKLTQEGKATERGPATTRTGYLCDEYLIRAMVKTAGRLVFDEMNSPMGPMPANRVVFLTSYKHFINQHDCLILPHTDEDGNLLNPVTIHKEYIATVEFDRRLDGGRPEFYATIAELQK